MRPRDVGAGLVAAAAALLAMAGTAAAGLLLLDAGRIGDVGALTAAVVALAAGGPATLTATPPGDVPIALHAGVEVMPLGVTVAGAAVLGALLLRHGRDGMVVRGAAATVAVAAGLLVVAQVGSGTVAVRLPGDATAAASTAPRVTTDRDTPVAGTLNASEVAGAGSATVAGGVPEDRVQDEADTVILGALAGARTTTATGRAPQPGARDAAGATSAGSAVPGAGNANQADIEAASAGDPAPGTENATQDDADAASAGSAVPGAVNANQADNDAASAGSAPPGAGSTRQAAATANAGGAGVGLENTPQNEADAASAGDVAAGRGNATQADIEAASTGGAAVGSRNMRQNEAGDDNGGGVAGAAAGESACPDGGLPFGDGSGLGDVGTLDVGYSVAGVPTALTGATGALVVLGGCRLVSRSRRTQPGRTGRWTALWLLGVVAAGMVAAGVSGGAAAAGGVLLVLPLAVVGALPAGLGVPLTVQADGPLACALDGAEPVAATGSLLWVSGAALLSLGIAAARRSRTAGPPEPHHDERRPLRRAGRVVLGVSVVAGVGLAATALVSRVSVELGAFGGTVSLLDARLAADPVRALGVGAGAGAAAGLAGLLIVAGAGAARSLSWRPWRDRT